MIRLDKYLAEAGVGTRSQVKKAIRDGHVKINGEIAKHADIKVDEDHDIVQFDDEEVWFSEFVYIMLNKPQGYISASRGWDPNVIDLIAEPFRNLFPVGRLDKDTEGLLLITNDGQLAHELLSPKKQIEKEYYTEISVPLNDEDIEKIRNGITWHEETYRPAEYKKISDYSCTLTVTEGKYHEIKRMIQALGSEVTYLKRIRMKNLVLDETLKPGEYRFLSEEELNDLKAV